MFALALAFLAHGYATTLYHGDVEVPRGDGDYRPFLAVQDGHWMYLQVMSAVLSGELDITDEVERFGEPGNRFVNPSGEPVFPHAIGPVIAWAPAFALAHVAAGSPPHGYTLFHQRVVYATSAAFVWLAALLGFLAARRYAGGRWKPLLAAVAILLGTNLSYYAIQRPDYGHALSALAGAGFLAYWSATAGALRWRRYVALGALLGAAALVRTANVLLGAAVAIELAHAAILAIRGRRGAREVALVAARGGLALAVAAVVFVPQLAVWAVHYESGWLSPPHGGGYVHLGQPMLTEFLFSSQNGYFSTHPLAYAGALGLLVAPRGSRLVCLGLLVSLAVLAYANSCVYDWWGMGSYGARRMCSAAFAVVVGLAVLLRAGDRLLRRVPRWGRGGACAAVLAWFVVWNQSYTEPARARRASVPLRMCCGAVPDAMAAVAEPVHDRIGNPFALPASLMWSLRWDAPVAQFGEVVIGTYAARPNGRDLVAGRAETRYWWNIPGVNFTPWLAGGLGPRQRYRDPEVGRKRNFRWTTRRRAGVFVPLFLRARHRIEIPVRLNLAPDAPPRRIAVVWNREHVVVDRPLGPGWHLLRFDVPPGRVLRGTNMLQVITRAVPYQAIGAPRLPPPPKAERAGAALRQMTITIDDPRR